MLSFARQVQAMCDHAKNCTALLSGVEAPKYEDSEKSLAELIARIPGLPRVGPPQSIEAEKQSAQ